MSVIHELIAFAGELLHIVLLNAAALVAQVQQVSEYLKSHKKK